jgi:hypothetical protein
MDYSDESCRRDFTAGQFQRMHDQLTIYRGFEYQVPVPADTSPFHFIKSHLKSIGIFATVFAGSVIGMIHVRHQASESERTRPPDVPLAKWCAEWLSGLKAEIFWPGYILSLLRISLTGYCQCTLWCPTTFFGWKSFYYLGTCAVAQKELPKCQSIVAIHWTLTYFMGHY